MAKPVNKTKTIHEIEQEMQKIQQEVDARNAKIEALQQQKLQVVLEAKCTFFDVIYDAALKDAIAKYQGNHNRFVKEQCR